MKFKKALKKLKKFTGNGDSRPFLQYVCFAIDDRDWHWWGMASDGFTVAKIPVDISGIEIPDNCELFVIHREQVGDLLKIKKLILKDDGNVFLRDNNDASHYQHYARKLRGTINEFLANISIPHAANFDARLLRKISILDGYAKIHYGRMRNGGRGMLAENQEGGVFALMGLSGWGIDDDS